MISLILFLTALTSPASPAAPPKSAPFTIEAFYRKYLGSTHREKLSLPFSSAFRALQKEDAAACRKFAVGDVCGFGADGDIYLDAQDFDPKLTYASAGFKANETEPGRVTVSFNLFPHDKANGNVNPRTIVFAMVRENGTWVVDDILGHGESARKQLRNEIGLLQKK